MKITLSESAEINNLSQLRDAVNGCANALPGVSVDPRAVTLIDTLRLRLFEVTLTDGSRVYDVQLSEV